MPVDQYAYGKIKELNPYYFHFREGPFKELVLDSVKLAILRKACE